jgi:hypothetical protein
MRHTHMHETIVLTFGILCFALAASPAAAQPSHTELARTADIVFVGTVTRIGATASAAVESSPKAMVVRVDELTAKPPAISLKQGDSVTVFAKEPNAWHAGDRAVFYTAWMVSADTVAVEEQGHEPATAAGHAMAGGAAQPRATQQAIADQKLRRHIDDADQVVVGKVVSVAPAPAAEAVAERGIERAPRREPISEHNPNWQQAVIQVESPIKGAQPSHKVTVLFPGSRDVAYKNFPKLSRGQQGTFFIGKPRGMARERGEEAAGAPLTVQKVLPRTEAAHVRSLAHD